jgi:hypothetical protein
VQDEDHPLIGVEAAEATLELIAIGDVEARVGVGPRLVAVNVDLDGPAVPSATDLAVARTDKEPWSQASKRSGSRKAERSRQAATSASCVASSARPSSRRIRRAVA